MQFCHVPFKIVKACLIALLVFIILQGTFFLIKPEPKTGYSYILITVT